MTVFYKSGSFTRATILGTVKEVKEFSSKKDGKEYTALVVATEDKYTTKEGEAKSLISEVKVFIPGKVEVKSGAVVLIEGDVGTAKVPFKAELKYPVEQVVVSDASVQVVSEAGGASFSGLNSFELIGRIGRQPREIKGGKGCDFSLAVSPKNRETLWIPISFWGQRGMKLLTLLNKGDLVRIVAKASLTNKKVGEEEKKVMSLYGSDVQILARSPKNGESSAGSSEGESEQTQISDEPEEIPF